MKSSILMAAVCLVACTKASTTLPQDFAGSYTHTTTTQFGIIQQDIVDELTVSTSGISVKSSDPMKMKGGIQMGGNPMNHGHG
jgi:hypothetical protein